jgi:hypothetical protein
MSPAAMVTVLLDANRAARDARERGDQALDQEVLARIRNHYLGALAHGAEENQGTRGPLTDRARTLIIRFRRFEDMILRFATDLTVPFHQQRSRARPPTGQGPATQRRRSLAHPAEPDRLRDRRVLPRHQPNATNSTRSADSSPPAPGYPASNQLNRYLNRYRFTCIWPDEFGPVTRLIRTPARYVQ